MFFKHQLDVPASAIDREHLGGRQRHRIERGDEQQPPCHQEGWRGDSPTCFLRFATPTDAGTLRSLGVEFGRNQPHPITLLLPPAPPLPLTFRAAPLAQPPQDVKRLSRLRFEREGRWVHTHDDVGLLRDHHLAE